MRGQAAPSHLAAVYFQTADRHEFQFVPYRGTGPALQDLIAGQIDLMFDQASNSLPQVRGGSSRPLRVTAKTRLASAPEIPTMDEAGCRDFMLGLVRHLGAEGHAARTSIAKLNAAVVAGARRSRRAQAAHRPRARTSRRASSRRRRRSRASRRPRSRSGGRSSRPPASRRSSARKPLCANCLRLTRRRRSHRPGRFARTVDDRLSKPADQVGRRLRARRRHRYARPPFNGRARSGTRASDLCREHRRSERLYRLAECRGLHAGWLHAAHGGERIAIWSGFKDITPTFDPVRELDAVASVAHSPLALCVADAVPVNSVKELIAYSHSSGKTLNYASAGTGSVAQLVWEVVKDGAKIDALSVPYRGGGPAMAAIIAGQVDIIMASSQVAKPLIEDRRIKALAVTGKKNAPRRCRTFRH